MQAGKKNAKCQYYPDVQNKRIVPFCFNFFSPSRPQSRTKDNVKAEGPLTKSTESNQMGNTEENGLLEDLEARIEEKMEGNALQIPADDRKKRRRRWCCRDFEEATTQPVISQDRILVETRGDGE